MSDNQVNDAINTLYKYFQAVAPIVLFIGLSVLVVIDLNNPNTNYLYWELVSIIVIIVVLPFVPYISSIRFRDAELDISDAEWMRDRGKLSGGTTATAEGGEIQRGRQTYDR